jgi:hypothetical protein
MVFTFHQKDMPDNANSNVHAALSNIFVCTAAFLIIIFQGD